MPREEMTVPPQILSSSAPAPSARRERRRRWGALVAISLATLMMIMDFMAVSVALPSARQSLGASFSEMQWVLEAFVLTLAAFVLTAGYIADMAGRRTVFLLGLSVLGLGSLLGGLAPNAYVLIGGRVLQGLGGALLFATGSVMLSETFASAAGRWKAALAVWGTVTGLAVAFSPLVGAAITRSLGWRWVFLIDAPTAAVALLVGLVTMTGPNPAAIGGPTAPAPTTGATATATTAAAPGAAAGARPDWRGLALFSAAIAILVIGLVRTASTLSGWTANGVLACFACTALLLVAFIAVESVSPAPMLDISLFRQRTFTGSSIAAFGLSAAVLGPFLFLVLYLSYDLGLSTFAIGSRLLLLTGMTVPFLPLTGALDRFVPAKVLICGGLTMVAVGFWLMSHLTATSTASTLFPGLIVAGVGLELVNPRLAAAAVAAVKPQLAAVASRTSSTFRHVGTATGMALFGALLATRLTQDLNTSLASTPLASQGAQVAGQALTGQLSAAAVTPGAPADIVGLVHNAFADSMHEVLLVAAIVALASAVLALSVRSRDVSGARTASPAPATAVVPGPGPTRTAQGGPDGAGSGAGPSAQGSSSPDHSGDPNPQPQAEPQGADRSPAPEGEPVPPAPTTPVAAPAPGAPTSAPALAVPEGAGAPSPDARGSGAAPLEATASPVAEQAEPAGQGTPLATVAVPSEAGLAGGALEGPPVGPVIDLDQIQRHIRGQVTTVAGDPLAGATVTLVHPNGDEVGHTTAAEDGTFDLDHVDEGTYTLVAVAPHYRPAASVVALGDREARASVRLLGVGSLVVRVARALDGVPLGAELELLNPEGGLTANCQTGDDGVAILPDLLEGDYELTVKRDNYLAANGPVVVRRGRTGTAEVHLVGLGHLYGAVLGPNGGWLPGLEVVLSDPSGAVMATTRTDAAGSYLFAAVTEGSYSVGVPLANVGTSVEVGAGSAVLADLVVPTLPPLAAFSELGLVDPH
jgi:hypothetical protein